MQGHIFNIKSHYSA